MTNANEALLAGLERNETHVWFARTDLISTPQCVKTYYNLLSTDEQASYQKFHFERDRLVYLAAHGLLRTILSQYAPCLPECWRFVRTQHGKPQLEVPDGIRPFQFNLSHTQGMVACVVSLVHECGIDVEFIRPMSDLREVGEKIFSSEEITDLVQNGKINPRDFFSFWTLKEAYAKAIGSGLFELLKEITFDLTKSPIQMRFSSQISDGHGEWLFHLFSPSDSHQVAVAVRQGSRIVCREVELSNFRHKIVEVQAAE